MSLAKNGSSSHIPSFSRVRALKVDVKTKNGTPYCASVRLRFKGLELCTWLCLYAATAKGTREGMVVVTTPCMAACTCTLVKEAG